MDEPSLEALMLDPLKCRQLSMEQKRELVHEVSKWSESAMEILHAWSRQEILQVLCAELGKERKYTGLTKSKMIEQLLKIVYENKSLEHGTGNVSEMQLSLENGERTPKRQRKCDFLPIAAHPVASSAPDVYSGNSICCKNSACKAKLNSEDVFCKRCSCCICHKYDDNKDPSLWLTCTSDPPFNGMSCSMSCHLECAFQHSSFLKNRQDKGLDGSFSCVSCGKVNDLLGSWRKQLVEARDTRRVDILCYRLSLGQKILDGTVHYQNLYAIVEEAVKKLEEDVGPLTGVPVKMARGIVNRLSTGPEVQQLCASAVDSLNLILSNRVSCLPENFVRFEDVQGSSATVILDSSDSYTGSVTSYNLWHRKAGDAAYPSEPTCRICAPNKKFLLSGLTPLTNYFLKVVSIANDAEMGFCEFQFRTVSSRNQALNLNSPCLEMERSQSPATNCSSLSNPSSFEDETNNVTQGCNEVENRLDNYCSYRNCSTTTVVANLLSDSISCLDHSQKEAAEGISFLDEQCCAGKSNCIPLVDALNIGKKDSSNVQMVEETTHDSGSDVAARTGLECVPNADFSETGLPITPCRLENTNSGNGRNSRAKLAEKDMDMAMNSNKEPLAGSSAKKMSGEGPGKEMAGTRGKDFEYYVKVIRWLECDGHIETTFRQKFLTWYSMRATPQEVRIVKVFVDTFIEDPSSLAGQLVDTFSEAVSNKRCSTVRPGFCLKLWH